MFVIEKGIPLVRKTGGRGRKPTAFPLAQMEVGDSFLITCDVADKKAVDSWRRKLLTAKKGLIKAYPEAEGIVFSTVTEAGGLRVHRVE